MTGPGTKLLNLPAAGALAEAYGYRWLDDPAAHGSPLFRFRPIQPAKGNRPLAVTPDGKVFCVASDRGRGRLVYLSMPRGMSISPDYSRVRCSSS